MGLNKKRTLLLTAMFVAASVIGGITASALLSNGSAYPVNNAGFGEYLAALDKRIADLPPLDQSFVLVSERVTPAVVTIHADRLVSNNRTLAVPDDLRRFFGDDFFNDRSPSQQRSHVLGSGVIIESDGLILTNNHVVDSAEEIKVTLADRRTLPAELVGADANSDLALLRVKEKNLPFITLGDSDSLKVGQWVLAVGNPFSENLRQTVTAGIVSATGRGSGLNIGGFQDFIQTDAAINPGNSGGALVNLDGDLVGINTFIASNTGTFAGIGFAVPSNLAKSIISSLLEHGRVVRGYLGVLPQDMNDALARAMGFDRPTGAVVGEVETDTPAEKAGLQRGDVILSIDGEKINDSQGLRNRIGLAKAGSTVKLHIKRGDKEMDVNVTLSERQDDLAQSTDDKPTANGGSLSDLGFARLDNMGPDYRQYFGAREGVVILQVTPYSPAAEAGLDRAVLITEVNRKAVKSVTEFRDALAQMKPGDVALIYGFVSDRNGNVAGQYYPLEIPRK